MPQEYVTKEGYEKIKKELEDLKNVKRREIANRIAEAKDLGDLSENAEYAAAKDEMAFNEGKIEELEEIVKNAAIINNHKHSSANVGSTVKFKNGALECAYTIVGHTEADPGKNRISNESPLGKAFLGKRVGDEIEIRVPKGMIKVKITEVS